MGSKAFAVNNSAAASITFNPSINLKDGVSYLDTTTELSSPRGAVVKHTMGNLTEAAAVDRHYIQFTKTVYDAMGKPQTASVAISVVIPRTQITAAHVEDLRAFAKNFAGDNVIWPAFCRGDY